MSDEWFRGLGTAFSCAVSIFFIGNPEARICIVLLSKQMMMKQENAFMDGDERFILPLNR
jgi:ATP-dependent protease ClpP protease subunit